MPIGVDHRRSGPQLEANLVGAKTDARCVDRVVHEAGELERLEVQLERLSILDLVDERCHTPGGRAQVRQEGRRAGRLRLEQGDNGRLVSPLALSMHCSPQLQRRPTTGREPCSIRRPSRSPGRLSKPQGHLGAHDRGGEL